MTFSDRLQAAPPPDAEATTSASYQAHLATFLAALVFWQDLLDHCTSAAVQQTLLDHFKYLFLQQLLYPSLLESSDVDGGSSVAVLTYLRHILEALENPHLVQLTLQFLFGLHESQEKPQGPERPIMKARRRKSEDLLATLSTQGEQVSPDLFNLSDLIMASLRSTNQQTVAATLHILSAMLRRPNHRALTTLLRARTAQPSDDSRTLGAHEMEVDKILTLAESLTTFEELETSYEQHLHDNRNLLETHACSVQLLKLPVSQKHADVEGLSMAPTHRFLELEDPTLTSLFDLLTRFFENDVETNLGLTQVFVDLAACGYTRLEGWLLTSPSAYTFPAPSTSPSHANGSGSDGPADPQIRAIQLARRHPLIASSAASPFLQTLSRLAATVNAFRRTILDFDAYLLSVRAIINPPPQPPSYPTTFAPTPSAPSSHGTPTKRPASLTPSRSPSRPLPGTPGSPTRPIPIPARLPPASTTPSISSSPRGRALLHAAVPTLEATPRGSPRRSPTRAATPRGSTPRAGTPLQPAPPPVPPALWRRVRADTGRDARVAAAATLSPTTPDADEDSDAELGASSDSASDGSADGRVAPRRRGETVVVRRKGGEGGSDEDEGGAEGVRGDRSVRREGEVALGCLLTNVVLLQEFALEIAALAEARAGLFGEVRFF